MHFISVYLDPVNILLQLFDSVSESHLRSNSTLKLVGVVCYYSKHYSTFFFHSKMKIWVLFDDTNVQEVKALTEFQSNKTAADSKWPPNSNSCLIEKLIASILISGEVTGYFKYV